MEMFLGPDQYSLVVIIPPEVWTGYKGMSEPFAIDRELLHPSARSDPAAGASIHSAIASPTTGTSRR